MKELQQNGYIIQKAESSAYRGVEGDNWYLNYLSTNPYFKEFYEENIEKEWLNPDFVECCADAEYISRYVEESNRLGIPYRILLCSTDKPEPKLDDAPEQEGTVLGYDCAYTGGSYYSCIVNDILSGRIQEFHGVALNKNGLFATQEEAEKFMKYRDELKKQTTEYVYEEGNFAIYKITEIAGL